MIELSKPQSVRVADDQRVGVGDVDAVLDDRRTHEHVRGARIERAHVLFERALLHLPVSDDDARLGDDRLDLLRKVFDAVDAVVQYERLSAAREFAHERVAQQCVGQLGHIGLHRDAAGRRGLQHAYVADARHSHVERARYRCRRQRQHVDVGFEHFELFFVLDAETLLFVKYDQPQIVELHVL